MATSLLLLAGGWALFGALHSLLVERRVRSLLRFPPFLTRVYRLAYNLLSVSALAGLVIFAAGLHSEVIYEIDGVARIPFHVVRSIGAVLGLVSVWQLGMLEFLGIPQLFGRRTIEGTGLRTDGLYALCRHPMGLGCLLMLWGSPWMSSAYLVTAAALTVYLLVGTWFEERNLISCFPAEYPAYCRRVPALLPAVWRTSLSAPRVTPAVPVERPR